MTQEPKKRNIFKRMLSVIISFVILLVLVLSSYVFYLSLQYYRINDNVLLEVFNNSNVLAKVGEQYSVTTYNIGFGAYDHEFSFFMDSGTMKTGQKISGTGSRATSKDVVLANTNGALSVAAGQVSDFVFLQEVDLEAQRSHGVNQFEMAQNAYAGYSSQMTLNFHSGYLFYPIFQPHGSVTSGLATFSKYKIQTSIRRSFPVDNGFFAKFFDLDRCFVITRLPLENSAKQLVLINLHMSAYDKGGKIRAQQLEMLNEVINFEYTNGNYVIAGGDFNHDIANSLNTFETTQNVPEWVFQLTNAHIPDNFDFVADAAHPTCRSTDMAYVKGENYTVVIDGFLVSDNVEVISVQSIDTDFMFSDHNPVNFTFKLI